jgi:hypothetical protein
MTERASIFDQEDDDVDVAGFKPAAAARPRDPQAVAALRQTAESKGFVSREASPAPALRAPVQPSPASAEPMPQEARLRRRRTGRDKQLNIKTTDDCLARMYAIADAHGWGLGETLEQAIAALEVQLAGAPRP